MMHVDRAVVLVVGLLALALCAPAMAARDHPGFVDGNAFIEIAGDEAVTVEVSLAGSLLRAISGFDDDLNELAGGLESIHAVILTVENAEVRERLIEHIGEVERKLRRDKWQRITRVKDEDAEVKVYVLDDGEMIQGLVVMVVEHEEGEVVFVNIAGTIDIKALARLGRQLDLPGLDDLSDSIGDD